jgi:hypothetical protein
MMRNVNGFIGNTATDTTAHWGGSGPLITDLGHQIDGIEAQYQSNDQQLMDGLYQIRDAARSSNGGSKSSLQALAKNTLITQANRDTPLPALTVAYAMDLLIAQMTGADTVKASVVAAGGVTAVGSPHGDPAIVFSTLYPTGLTCEYAIAETVRIVCTADAQQGATAGSERVKVYGQSNGSRQPLDWDWPLGSSCAQEFTVADPTLDNQGGKGNLLTNSDFEAFVGGANYPDNWVIKTGSAGTTVTLSSTAYSGSKSLCFPSDGATKPDVYQTFNHATSTTSGAGGTPAVLKANTQYAYSFRVRMSATPANGTLTISLTDGSDGVTADANSANNTADTDLTAIPTSWVIVKGTFRTPGVLPTALRLHLALTGTAVDNAKSVFIDHLAMTEMISLYAGGPSVSVHSGAATLINGFFPDTWASAISNTTGVFQRVFEQFFGMTTLVLPSGKPAILPSAGSPSIADSLVG